MRKQLNSTRPARARNTYAKHAQAPFAAIFNPATAITGKISPQSEMTTVATASTHYGERLRTLQLRANANPTGEQLNRRTNRTRATRGEQKRTSPHVHSESATEKRPRRTRRASPTSISPARAVDSTENKQTPANTAERGGEQSTNAETKSASTNPDNKTRGGYGLGDEILTSDGAPMERRKRMRG